MLASGLSWRICIICRQSGASTNKGFLLARTALSPAFHRPQLPSRRLVSSSSSSGDTSDGKSSKSLAKPLDVDLHGGNVAAASAERRSADPNNELREYIEYSKVNSWHAAVGRKTPGKQRWKYERFVIGVCVTTLLFYIYVRPENSTDEQFGLDEFGKGLFRPHPAMEHHIAATIQTVESHGGDATLYRQQLKILLKEKELQLQRQQQLASATKSSSDVKYDPKIHDVKY